ncbi:MAG: RluA family pseudouridine synthase [Desulfurobacteriaceae bacterium]
MFRTVEKKVEEPQKLIDIVSAEVESRKKAKKIIDEGLCSVNGVKNLYYRKLVKPQSIVRFSVPEFLFKKKDFQILFEDEYLIVVNKPPFINSNKDFPNIEVLLRKKYKDALVVHRLDKHTTGALIVAKSKRVFDLFVDLFKKRKVKKIYTVLVADEISKKKGRITIPLDGKEAVTNFRLIEDLGSTSLLEVEILTGRKHQIRKHFSFLSHPVVGEFKYWKRRFKNPLHLFAPRIMLHAKLIAFPHPVNGRTVRVEAPLFKDFEDYLEFLKKGGSIPQS